MYFLDDLRYLTSIYKLTSESMGLRTPKKAVMENNYVITVMEGGLSIVANGRNSGATSD
jgi:hypothetical protein